ncbi:transcription/translation regulatory transformer protein RfaH [Candidatus Thioglobus sp.]|nr:transcription/translation regulatory transformer protein RfaH [Candidatus Thioglobus sp.]
MRSWYLIKTKSRQEHVAIKNLENQEYITYCPTVKIKNKHIFLFPGYLFIYLDKEIDNWLPIRSTKGVLNFVRFGLNFAQAPDAVIKFLKDNELFNKEKFNNLNRFKSGDKVQITDGIFKNCVAIFKSSQPEERIVLLLNILGQQQSISIKKESVMRL